MKLKELAELVKQMRDAQNTYFKEKSRRWSTEVDPQWLSTAKELERRVDSAVKNILDGQKKLF